MEESKVVELYQTMLENQSSNYSTLITAFIALTALLVGSTWLWNFLAAKKQIQNAVISQVKLVEQKLILKYDKVIEKKIQELEENYASEILSMEGDLSRIFAIHCEKTDDIQNAIDWWASALDKFIASDSDDLIRISIDSLHRIVIDPNLNTKINKETFEPKYPIEVVKNAPILLEREKSQILKVLSKYQNNQ